MKTIFLRYDFSEKFAPHLGQYCCRCNILRFRNITLNISGGGIGKNVLWVMLMTVKKLEECHDVLQAGRARRAEAGRAGLFTERACSTLERVRELCTA